MTIPYRIHVHPRARHVRLRMDPREGLVVTVPRSFDKRQLPDLIEQKRGWIESIRARQAGHRDDVDAILLGPRPERVDLAALGRSWSIRYRNCDRSTLGFAATESNLTISLPKDNPDWIDERLAHRLRAWLFERAREHLVPLVEELADAHGFRHGPITIRNQRARWGSCSADGRLSLNARLLFASPQACRYVLVHELAHTEHPNHSSAFWNRVAQLDPDCQQNMAELKAVWQRLPDWV
jgi:predicted metal-dependent hydrolase